MRSSLSKYLHYTMKADAIIVDAGKGRLEGYFLVFCEQNGMWLILNVEDEEPMLQTNLQEHARQVWSGIKENFGSPMFG